MNLWFSSSKPDFWHVFDELATTQKPRRAVLTFVGLGLFATVTLIVGSLLLSNYLQSIGVILSNVLSFDGNGILAKPAFWGLFYSVLMSIVWTNVMFHIRSLALSIGDGARSIDQ